MLKINKLMVLGLILGVCPVVGARYDNPFISTDEQRIKNMIEPNRPIDQLVTETLQRSGTWWRNSSDWQQKILSCGAQEHTWFSGDVGHGHSGNAEFTINNNFGRINVNSKFETTATVTGSHALQAILNGGTKMTLREAELESRQNVGNTRCEHRLIIKRQGPTAFERALQDAYNHPNCTNYNCNNRECVRLREQRLNRDVAALVVGLLAGKSENRYQVTWIDECHSEYKARDLFPELRR